MNATANAACRVAEDEWLSAFDGMTSPSQEQIRKIVRWKFSGIANRLKAAMRSVDEEWVHVEACVKRGSAHTSDLGALDELLKVNGWGPAMSSAVLMAGKPCVFTVGDVRALLTLSYLNLYQGGSKEGDFVRSDWVPYLETCRNLSQTCNLSLRDVDRALWAAKGRPGP